MKRFIAATVAVATAFSLSNGVASAASSDSSKKDNKGAEVSTWVEFMENTAEKKAIDKANPNSDTHEKDATSSKKLSGEAIMDHSAKSNSSNDTKLSALNSYWDLTKGSYKSDVENGWANGTTQDIILGVGIVAAIFAVIANFGQVAGFKFPAMP
ncbi:MAG: hypothetical protein SOW59_01885, partial [Corynebacterium sp.]|nr:hypothetical protein [Corynebacterium sp.]